MNNPNGKKLMIQPHAGLGNRLYCLYSAFYYKRITNNNFNILWDLETCCNVRFDELFDIASLDNDIKVKTIYHLGYKNRYGLLMILSDIYLYLLKKRYKYYTSIDTRDLYADGGEKAVLNLIEQNKKVCIKSFGSFFEIDKFDMVRNDILPAKGILDRVDSIMPSADDSLNTVGIHIRRTDHIEAIENSPLEAFIKVMDEELKQNSDTKFYLATDDNEVEEELSGKYDFVNKDNFGSVKSRNNREGIKDAFVEMLCLSRCKKIYGSFGSTFSEMASLIGNIELEVVTKK